MQRHQDPRQLAQRLRAALVSPRVGLVHELAVRHGAVTPFGVHIATALPARHARTASGATPDLCGGVAFDEDGASIAALMEAVERYCLRHGALRRACQGPARDATYLYGQQLGVFADWQYGDPRFPFVAQDRGQSLRWIRGRSLVDGGARHIPLAWVAVPFEPLHGGERLYCSNSSGTAAGRSARGALERALFEVCERDAFMVMWHHRLALPRLAIDVAALTSARFARQIAACPATLTFVNLTNNLQVPVAMCVLEAWRAGRRIRALGVAAAANIEFACRKALLEGAGQLAGMIDLVPPAWRPAADFSNVTEFPCRSLLYNLPEMAHWFDFMTASAHLVAPAAVPALASGQRGVLAALLGRLRPHAGDIVAVPLASPEIAALGIHVVKAVVPGLASLYADHRYPHLGAARIWSAAAALGASVQPPRLPHNCPHPLA
ncbi:YcaO-like family protein [Massilia sp. DWR3-1-1]|uniref:YcaO-like family protein n=1 Tax=Massilia sp. DWR3-1-1 TaxID=2804559 RepID=UPI003CFB120A